MDILILIGGFTLFCLLGMPVAYALGLAAIFAALWIDLPLEAVMLKTSDGMDDFALLAIPFFILAGGIMAEGGMAARLVNLAKVFVGFLRGGLALVNILASTMFGCISGSSVADTASIGSVMIPQMIKERLSAAVRGQRDDRGLAAAAADPAIAQRGDLFARRRRHDLGRASVHRRHHPGPAARPVADDACASIIAHRDNFPKGEVIPLRQALTIAVEAIWGLLTVFIIIGGILSGIFTPTESAAVACIYSFLVTMFIYRDYKWSELPLLVGRVVRTVGMVMIMIGFSVAFGYMMAIMQVPGEDHAVLPHGRRQQVYVPAAGQHPAAGARDLHGSRADAADLHADLPAGDQDLRHRSGAFRDDHDPQSRHRPADAAGRTNAGGRLRHRQGDAWRRCRRAS